MASFDTNNANEPSGPTENAPSALTTKEPSALAPLPRERSAHGTQSHPTPPPIPAIDFAITVEPMVTVPKPEVVDEAPPDAWLAKLQAVNAPAPTRRARDTLPPPITQPQQRPPVPFALPVVETKPFGVVDHGDLETSPFVPPPKRVPVVAWSVGGAIAVAGLAVGYLSMQGARAVKPAPLVRARPAATEPAPAKPAVVEPAPVKPAVVEPAPVKPAAIAGPVRVPITSHPAGATVTLVDGEHAELVGRTPMTLEVDPTRSYDVAVTLVDHKTRIEHLDPATMHALAVDLGKPTVKRGRHR